MLSIAKVSEKEFSDVELVTIEKTRTGFQVTDEDSGMILVACTSEYKYIISALIRHFNWTVCNDCLYEHPEFAILDDTEENRKDEDISFRFIMQA